MFNLLLALMVGILIGWNFNAFYSALNTPKIINNDINISQSIPIDPSGKSIEKEKIKIADTEKTLTIEATPEVKTPPKTSQTDTFYTLLNQNLFSDAMALYLDANQKNLSLYRVSLEEYFQKKSLSSPEDAIREMLEYIELEPEHRNTQLQLIETYKNLEQYKKAINLLTELIETTTHIDNDKLNSNLLSSSQSYIELLKNSKNFQELSNFLEERIEHGLHLPFYIYALAEHHVTMQKFAPAIKLLKELEFDDEYGEKAKNLLLEIEKAQAQEQEYVHKLPLIKKGEHYTIEVMVDNTPLTLLLDTGATLTMINEDKLSSLTMINDHITLKTAGGEIPAQIQEAQSFNVGDIELQNFQVTTSAYKQEKADGLLGMNFFKEFKFKIDQEESVLYLSERKTL
ncbi:retroviral-like aspartic protease family protein [bacterium]|nr:retroviral-like aspartic protease family protein [bacterium]MBU1958555.1 retroviral-like aspartic protease family protein [bacterium]